LHLNRQGTLDDPSCFGRDGPMLPGFVEELQRFVAKFKGVGRLNVLVEVGLRFL
jgi:hypothetical protein